MNSVIPYISKANNTPEPAESLSIKLVSIKHQFMCSCKTASYLHFRFKIIVIHLCSFFLTNIHYLI